MSTIVVSAANLSLQEQVELGKKMSEGDKAAREKLILCCVPLAKSFAGSSLSKNFSSGEDIFQDAMLGALAAVDLYDYRKNVKFTTFAYSYMHKYITQGIVAQLPLRLSEDDYFYSILLKSTIETFIDAHHVPPTDEQLAALTKIPLKTIKLLRSRDITDMVVSLSAPGSSLLSLPQEDVGMMVERILTESARKQIIADALECLTDDEREIVTSRLMRKRNKMTLQQLAERQGVQKSAIANREKAAVRKLLAYFMKHHIDFEDLVC